MKRMRLGWLGVVSAAALAFAACGDDTDATGAAAGEGGAGVGATGGTGGSGAGTGAGGSGKCDTLADAPYSDALTHLGRDDGFDFIEILDLQVRDDNIVFGCTSVRGLNVWDVSGGAGPSLIQGEIHPPGLSGGQLEHCQHVALDPSSGEVVMTNRGDEIEPQPFVWLGDFSDPNNGRPVAGYTGPESIEGAALRDGRVWVRRMAMASSCSITLATAPAASPKSVG